MSRRPSNKLFEAEHNDFLKSLNGKCETYLEVLEIFNFEFGTDYSINQIENALHRNKCVLKGVDNRIEGYVLMNSKCKLISFKKHRRDNMLELVCPCGDIFYIPFGKFKEKKNKVCKKCSTKINTDARRLSQEEVELRMKEMHPNIRCFDKFTKAADYAKFECVICNHKWSTTWNNLFSKHGCAKCDDIKKGLESRYDYDKICELLPNVNNNIKLLTMSVISSHQVLEWECLKCGSIFKKNWNNVREGQDCTACSSRQSLGEKRVYKFLKSNKIQFEKQYKFDNCISPKGRKLSFDFGVFLNDKLICIEYDGIQHFEPVSFGADYKSMLKNFEKSKMYDNIKNEYCKNNDIKLIRIPYWEFDNIESLIGSELNLK